MDRDGYCCLCGEDFTNYGNYAWPLREHDDDRCCDTCNNTQVIPARLRLWWAKPVAPSDQAE